MSSKYTFPFLSFTFHPTIFCCLLTLVQSPVNLVSQGPFPPLKVVLGVNPKRFQQESVTEENVMNRMGKHFFLLFEKKTENTLRCHDLYFQTLE